MLEIKPYKWKINGENHAAYFFPFIDGEPRHDINCVNCKYFTEGRDCKPFAENWNEEKAYPFCGPICGHFSMGEDE